MIRNHSKATLEAPWATDELARPQKIGFVVTDSRRQIRYASEIAKDLCFNTLTVGETLHGLCKTNTGPLEDTIGVVPTICELRSPTKDTARQVVFHPIPIEKTSVVLFLVYPSAPDPSLSANIQAVSSFLSNPASEDIRMLVHLEDGTVVQATSSALSMFARHRNVILGESYDALVKERDDWESEEMASGVTHRIENTIVLPNGEKFISQTDLQRISVGGINLFLRTFLDTATKTNPSLLSSEQEGPNLQRFAGGIAHELNNVLTVLVAAFEELREYADEPQTVHELADEIETATARAKSMSHRLLSLSGRDSSRIETIQISERIEHCVKDFRHSVGSKYTISAVLDTENAAIDMDRLKFDQILETLVSNACEAMPDGGAILIDVSIGAQAADGSSFAKISVSDTGHGISPTVLPRIFDRFFTTRAHGMNAGLGLDTAKEFVESVGGTIFVANSESTGTTISFRLPCSMTSCDLSSEPDTTRLETNKDHLVVVVDDEDAVRKYVRRCLERDGYRVISARDGQEGFELVSHYHEQNQPVSAIISDMLMPRMGGPEMAKKLSDLCPNIPFLFISGYTNERVPESISAETEFLHKPFAHSVLSATLRRLIINQSLVAQSKHS